MSHVQTFRAPTMDEALELVRCELGRDAVVLQIREVSVHRWLAFGRKRTHIEVTAGTGIKTTRDSDAHDSTPSVRHSQFGPRSAALSNTESSVANLHVSTLPSGTIVSGRISTSESTSSNHADSGRDLQDVMDRLRELESLVRRYQHRAEHFEESRIEGSGFQLYLELLDAGFWEQQARTLIREAQANLPPREIDIHELRDRLVDVMSVHMHCQPGVTPSQNSPSSILLTGPSGSQLGDLPQQIAAEISARTGLSVAPQSSLSTRNMSPSPSGTETPDLFLVPREYSTDAERTELQNQVKACKFAAALLVVNSRASEGRIKNIAESWIGLPNTTLVLTRLNPASRLGHLWTLLGESPSQISYLSLDDAPGARLERPAPRGLARLLIGHKAAPLDHPSELTLSDSHSL